MSRPLVSILIPCHNASPYLEETVDSALAQTFPDTEVILVDDGSTDDSLLIARRYEPRIRVITGPQRGASAARNLASREARGEWVQYLDADDLLLPEAIAQRVDGLQDIGDVACADWRRIVRQSDGAWKLGKMESGDPLAFADEPDLAVFKGFWAPPAALLYRRTLVEKIGGWHPSLPIIQDARFLFDAAWAGGRFVHIPGDGAHYRQHAADSLSSRSRPRFWADVLKNNREIEQLWAAAGRLDPRRRQEVAKAYGLGARVTFPFDRDLHRAYLSELGRFPAPTHSRYLRAAMGLERIVGYRAAARIMAALRP